MVEPITEKCLKSLPVGKFIRFEFIPMTTKDGRIETNRQVIVWMWEDQSGPRYGRFCVRNGEYLGDTF